MPVSILNLVLRIQRKSWKKLIYGSNNVIKMDESNVQEYVRVIHIYAYTYVLNVHIYYIYLVLKIKWVF